MTQYFNRTRVIFKNLGVICFGIYGGTRLAGIPFGANMTQLEVASDVIATKRGGYLCWEDYFMGIAKLSAERSKDPRTQVGACIVDKDKRIVGIGYNGMPNNCSDDIKDIWDKTDKHFYVCHAEMNAIMNKNATSVKGCTIYATLFPCNECSKLIIQSGITKVVYGADTKKDKKAYVESKKLLDWAKIEHQEYQAQASEIVIKLKD